MNPVEEMLARDEIRTLLARRVRCLDEKDWAGFGDCYAPDAVSYSFQAAIGQGVEGRKAITDAVATTLANITTVHQIHPGEITFVSDTTAEGITPLEDLLVWEQDGRQLRLHGFGHYRQTFEKADGRWLIKIHALTRLHVDSNATSEDLSAGVKKR